MKSDRENIYLAIIIIATLTVFFPTIQNGFTNWDDGYYLVNNPDITSLSFDNIAKIFSSFYVAQYVPLVILSFAVEYHFAGLDPFVVHFISLFLHLVSTVLVFSLVKKWKLSDEIAFSAALLFGIHPLHVEPVAWTSARKDTLSTVFLIGSMLSYYLHEEKLLKRYYFLSIGLFICALCSKATVMFLPFFFVTQSLLTGRSLKTVSIKMVPFFVSSIFIAGLVIFSLNSAGGLHLGQKFSIIETVSIASYDILFYISKTLVPIGLSSVYPFPIKSEGVLPAEMYIAFVVIIAGAVGIAYFHKKFEVLKVPLAFFIIALIPTLQFVSFGSMIAADRFMYVPMVGLLVVIMVAIDQLMVQRIHNKNLVKFVFTGIVILFGAITWNRIPVWKNSETLWTDAILNYPDFPISYFSRGQYYFSQNRYDKAFSDFDMAIERAPHYPHALNMRGYLYALQGKKEKALADFNNVIDLQPSYSVAYYNRGLLFMQQEKIENAISDLSQAIACDSSMVEAYHYRGLLLSRQKKYREAFNDFSTVLSFQPENVQALVNRGTAALKLVMYEQALKDLRYASVIDPKNKEIFLNLSILYNIIGKKDSAQYYFEKGDGMGQ